MPAFTTCGTCGFKGDHGFAPICAGVPMHFYHDSGGCDGCYLDLDGTSHPTSLEAFNATINKVGGSKTWKDAMTAELSGHERKALRLFKKWRAENGY